MTLDRSKPPDLGRIERARNQWLLDLHQRRFPRQTQRSQLVNPDSVSRFPSAWCNSDTATLDPGDTLTVDVSTSTDATKMLVFATIVVEQIEATAQRVDISGYFRVSGSDMNNALAFAEDLETWPANGRRTITATCLVDAGSSNGVKVQSGASTGGQVTVSASVQVLEVNAQSASCCTLGG